MCDLGSLFQPVPELPEPLDELEFMGSGIGNFTSAQEAAGEGLDSDELGIDHVKSLQSMSRHQ